MNIRKAILWLLLSMLGIGVAITYIRPKPENAATETAQAEPKPVPKPTLDIRAALPPKPEPSTEVVSTIPPPSEKPEKPDADALLNAERKRREALYWQQHIRNFNRQLAQLSGEKNPNRRQNLIHAISRYVQVDTLRVLEWAMALENSEERQAALEAINKNALNGIGARIEVDQTGLPKIRETTILSSIESTGLVEPGDYISGLVKPDGSVVQFKGLSIQQIVKSLRGKPGTETHLMMERISSDGVPYYFNVPVQRSMIVVQPPL